MSQKSQTKNKRRKILIIAGSRGEYGYFRPVIQAIKKRKDFDYEIVACNMHPLATFGSTIGEIQKDKFKIAATVHNTLDGYNHLTMVKSLGIFMVELPGIMERVKPDFLLIAGDRGEQFIGAIVAAHMYIPVAHIQAGELSGNIDGAVRHAITKLAHIHFCANKDAAKRVHNMGEENFRIHTVGASQLDELVQNAIPSREQTAKKFQLDLTKPSILLVQHSVTEEFDQTEFQMTETMKAVRDLGYQTIAIMNNSDAGSRLIRSVIYKYRTPEMKLYDNLPRNEYAGLMKTASVLVGNSSSGIIEAPLMKLAAVNIGSREAGRMQSTNVINAPHNALAIKKAVQKAITPAFQQRVQKAVSIYGDGHSTDRILDALAKMPVDDRLLVKRLRY